MTPKRINTFIGDGTATQFKVDATDSTKQLLRLRSTARRLPFRRSTARPVW
ncbi:MAG: hypothetical protein ACLT4C_05275 [Butyricicoccus sp.]